MNKEELRELIFDDVQTMSKHLAELADVLDDDDLIELAYMAKLSNGLYDLLEFWETIKIVSKKKQKEGSE